MSNICINNISIRKKRLQANCCTLSMSHYNKQVPEITVLVLFFLEIEINMYMWIYMTIEEKIWKHTWNFQWWYFNMLFRILHYLNFCNRFLFINNVVYKKITSEIYMNSRYQVLRFWYHVINISFISNTNWR